MPSLIDPSKPVDGVPAVKADLRASLQAAKDEIEALQSGKSDLGHTHTVSEISDAGALAGKNTVTTADIDANAVTATKIADGNVTNAKLADGAVAQSKIANAAVGASQLQDGIPIDMQGALLSGPELRGYAETSPTPAIGTGALTLDLAAGSVFEVTLTEDVSSLTLANFPTAGLAGAVTLILRQDVTGGRTVAWPSVVRWAGGAPPVITSAANAVDVYAFVTRDGGTTWYGFLGGKDFS